LPACMPNACCPDEPPGMAFRSEVMTPVNGHYDEY
jgi:hypothetical protein